MFQDKCTYLLLCVYSEFEFVNNMTDDMNRYTFIDGLEFLVNCSFKSTFKTQLVHR